MKTCLLISIGILTWSMFFAQPVWYDDNYTNISESGLKIVKDLRLKSKYYYLPLELRLAVEPNGKPKFKLLSVKYFPSNTGQTKEVKFLNILEMSVTLNQPSIEQIREISKKLPFGASLEPAPLHHIDIDLTVPGTIKADRPLNIGSTILKATPKNESYWQEKTFTLHLDNTEAQQVGEILKQNGLAISIHYKIWSEGANIRFRDHILNHSEKKEFTKEETRVNNQRPRIQDKSPKFQTRDTSFINIDTIIENQIVFTNALPIFPDLKKWPDLREQSDYVDILPARYSNLKVSCYDFVHETRPDLFSKKVIFKAVSDNNQPIEPQSIEFYNKESQPPMVDIKFPLPVHLRKPIQYNIEETLKNGSKIKSNTWKHTYIAQQSIDISTPKTIEKLEKKTLEIEILYPDSIAQLITRPTVEIEYYYKNTIKSITIPFEKSDYHSIDIWIDKFSKTNLKYTWYQNGIKWTRSMNTSSLDEYYLCKIFDK